MRRLAPLFAAVLLASCASVPAPRVAPVQTANGVVSAADPRAAEAGAAMLRQGGSAVDAAVATLLALNVVEPQSSGIGGGGFLVLHDAGGGTETIDGREAAPMAAGPDWFLTDGQPMSFAEAQPGGRSVGVPGNVRLIARALAGHGRLPWKAHFAPAIALARDGFVVTKRLHDSLGANRPTGALSAEARALYYDASGEPLAIGTLVRNPAMASFLERLAASGPDAFYVGPNAQAIAASVQTAPHNPSPMKVGDLAAYDSKDRLAVCGSYRGYRICGMGPPSSGGTTVLAMLGMLERFDLAALGPRSPEAWHLIAESMRLAYADRDRYLADSDFVQVPVAGLTERAYLSARSKLISRTSTISSATAGTPAGAPALAPMAVQDEHGTSHFVAVDRQGDVASLTSTIESAFGSGLMLNGYYLNNELTDFSFAPTKDGMPVANRVEGGKRPRSSMAPTIVYGPDGSVRLVVGAAGGATIIAQVAKAIIGVIDFKLGARDAIALPTLFAPGDTLYLERGTFLEAMEPHLRALGHANFKTSPPSTYKGNAVEWVGGRWVGAADPRSEGVAVEQ